MESVALTDHGNLYGAVEFYKRAKEKGIKPILGCEIYLAYEGMADRRPQIDDTIYHLIVLAKNEKGFQNIIKLLTKAHLEGFYYKPRVDEELLAKHADGLIALSGCLQGKVSKLVLAGKLDEAENQALRYQGIFGKGNFYLELQDHPNIPEQKKANDALVAISNKTGIPVVATADSHYLRKEDAEAQDILMLINTGAKHDDPERLTMKAEDFSLKSANEMVELFKDIPEAIENTQKIAEQCNVELELGKNILPHFDLPEGKTADDYLKELCYLGLEEKPQYKNSREATDRLEYELDVIRQTGFADYFLIVHDFVNWAKQNRIVVGPGRGSAAGSIVAYLLKITNVDPIRYKLLFERFLNPERVSMPDIDLDFADTRRDEVIEYVAQKYGRDRVAQIITFGTMAARAVVRDVGRALGYEYGYCDKAAKMIPFGNSLQEALDNVDEFKELYESDENAKRLIDLGKKLEGVARHASTHACGVVIAAEPLDTRVPLQHPTQSDEAIVTQFEMHAVEDIGLLKMDFLGLKNLSIIEETLKRIYAIRGNNIDIDTIPLDDPKVYKLLQEGDTTGVFQLECLSGDTIVSNTTIKKLYEKKNKEMLEAVYIDEGKVHKTRVKGIFKSGKKKMYAVITENGWHIKASQDHSFFTENGWKKLGEIAPGERVLMKTKARHLVYNACLSCGIQIDGQKEGKSKFCYRCSAFFYKNPRKKESREKIRKARIKFYKEGGRPWNDGLTKETNEILARTGNKIGAALYGRTWENLHGKEKAEELRAFHSRRMKGRNNHMFGRRAPHRRGGFRQDLRHYVRSSWEADFARILKLHNLEYEYEPKTFELVREDGNILHYTPDFYVKTQNTFYEIKGWMHELDQEKIDLFQKQYPQYRFTVINTTKFAEFAVKYKSLILWECPRVPFHRSFDFLVVKKIKYAGLEETYDIAMEEPGNNFVANGFVVHNSGGMRRYLKELMPTEFEDIIAMVALYRPGPMELIPDYIARKHGKKKITYVHPKLEPILNNTQGICIYQEQLMQIARELAGFSMGEADVLRKAVGKKIESLLLEQQEKVVSGMVKNGIQPKVANQLWEWVLPFAHYGFNRSHSACYATIAYQTAWLKANYPLEFMSALLTSERNDIERTAFVIEESRKMKIEVLPPDINESFAFFSAVPEKNQIRFGLLAIKNVGEGIVASIIKERKENGPYVSIHDFITRVATKDLNKKSMESMIKAGVFDQFGERNQLLGNMERLLGIARENQKAKENGQKGLFDNQPQLTNGSALQLEAAEPAKESELLLWEKELLGLYVTSHPLKGIKHILESRALAIRSLEEAMQELQNTRQQFRFSRQRERLRIGGIISSVKKIITKAGKPMLFMGLEDLTDKIEVVVFPSVIENYAAMLRENNIVFITGRLDSRDGEKKFLAEEVEEIVTS